MKRVIWMRAALSLLLICFFCLPLALAQGKPRVAVFDFENNSTWHWWQDRLGRAAADVFVTAMLESGQFNMIERDKVQALLAEQNFGVSGRVTPQTAAKIGQMLGVDLLLTGSVSQFSISRTGGGIRGVSVGVTTGKVVLQARLINTTTGEIVVAAEEQNTKRLVGARYRSINFEQDFDYGMANEIMHPAVDKMVDEIVDKAAGISFGSSHSGRVIKVSGNQVWINLGASSGVQVGDSFDVIRKGEELIDPDTGLSLGAVEEKVGVVVVSQIQEKYSIATLKSGSAEANDYLKKI
jgi:curli biogenesis system outer membrane secretion channel CsgG